MVNLAGLEALVLEELEKHLILNSNRLRTFEDAKFGWRIRDSMPSDTGSRAHCDPTDVDAVNSLSSGKEKGSSSHMMIVSSAVEHIFNETAMHAKGNSKASSGNDKQSRSWSKSDGKVKSKESEEKSKGSKGARGSYYGITSKTGLSSLETPKSETSSETQESAQTNHTDISHTDNSLCDDGWS